MYFKKNLHNDAINSLIELGNKNGFVSSNEVNSILPSFLLSSEQLPKVLEILKNKNIEYLNGSKNEITFQKYKKNLTIKQY